MFFYFSKIFFSGGRGGAKTIKKEEKFWVLRGFIEIFTSKLTNNYFFFKFKKTDFDVMSTISWNGPDEKM